MEITRVSTTAQIPTRANKFDAGLDLYYDGVDVTLMPGERRMFTTGIKMKIPDGYVGLIWPRSGLAAKFGIDVMAGVIDSTYRGVIQIVLINHSKEEIFIASNTKIAQILIQPIHLVDIMEVSNQDFESNKTSRGQDGFGSTG